MANIRQSGAKIREPLGAESLYFVCAVAIGAIYPQRSHRSRDEEQPEVGPGSYLLTIPRRARAGFLRGGTNSSNPYPSSSESSTNRSAPADSCRALRVRALAYRARDIRGRPIHPLSPRHGAVRVG